MFEKLHSFKFYDGISTPKEVFINSLVTFFQILISA